MALSILLGTIGIFTLTPPFSIAKINYTITKLNLIKALVNNGIDVYNSFYVPAGLTQVEYNADLSSGQAIVTLESDNGPTLNIPSSYIALAPVEPAVLYYGTVISIDLGDLPASVNLDQITSDVATMINGTVGVTSKVNLHVLPASKVYSHQDYITAEAIRAAKAEDYISFYSGKVAADNELAQVKSLLTQYVEIIKSQKLKIDQLTS